MSAPPPAENGLIREEEAVDYCSISQDYESVFELFPRKNDSTPPDDDPERDLDIVFFHGLQLGTYNGPDRAWENAWKNTKGDCWPRDWLPHDARLNGTNMRVLSVSYNARVSGYVTGIFGRTADGHYSISEALFHSLVSRWYVRTKPLVFVGHSYGGVVIKSLVVHCNNLAGGTSPNEEAAGCVQNLRGIVSYSVPNLGSNLAKHAMRANSILPLRVSKLVYSLKAFDKENARLSDQFSRAINGRGLNNAGIQRFAFAEGRDTKGVMVVPEASARAGHAVDDAHTCQGTDHHSVCKPNGKNAESYDFFVTKFLKKKIIEVDPSLLQRSRPPPPTASHS